MFIVLAVLIFGFLIAIHEIGHFVAAKKLGVRVLEFSIGMGPRLFKRQRGETLYSLKLLPFGGSCLMEGEDEEVTKDVDSADGSETAHMPDPRAFTSQSRPRRAVILAAGAFMNLLVGVIIIIALILTRDFKSMPIYDNIIRGVETAEGSESDAAPKESFMVGDRLYSVNRSRVYYFDDLYSLNTLAEMSGRDFNFVVIRNGEKISLHSSESRISMVYANGYFTVGDSTFALREIDIDLGQKLKYSMYESYNNVRSVWLSLRALVTGGASIKDMSGPVGIVDIMNQAGSSTHETESGEIVKDALSLRLQNIFGIAALIAINLAIVNLLPIPALDGGRIFGLIVTWLIEKISGRRVSPKYEGYVHAAGLILLLGLTTFILVNDVLKLF